MALLEWLKIGQGNYIKPIINRLSLSFLCKNKNSFQLNKINQITSILFPMNLGFSECLDQGKLGLEKANVSQLKDFIVISYVFQPSLLNRDRMSSSNLMVRVYSLSIIGMYNLWQNLMDQWVKFQRQKCLSGSHFTLHILYSNSNDHCQTGIHSLHLF